MVRRGEVLRRVEPQERNFVLELSSRVQAGKANKGVAVKNRWQCGFTVDDSRVFSYLRQTYGHLTGCGKKMTLFQMCGLQFCRWKVLFQTRALHQSLLMRFRIESRGWDIRIGLALSCNSLCCEGHCAGNGTLCASVQMAHILLVYMAYLFQD